MATILKKTIRRGDDFKVLITLKDRNDEPLDPTTAQFKFIYRDMHDNRYEVSYDGTKRVNNYIDNGYVVAVFENYKLICGVLKREAWYSVADTAFADGQWNYGDTQSSGIELTEQGGTKEVSEIVEVPDGISINETLVVSKGDKGIDGIDGKSAYQFAVEGGYLGTEAQFKEEQVGLTNFSGRLIAVEKNKANLVDGYVPSQEINPLQGKQTGFIAMTKTSNFYNTSFNNKHSYTSECLAQFDIDTNTSSYCIYNQIGQAGGTLCSFEMGSGGGIRFYIPNSSPQYIYSHQCQLGKVYHVIASVDDLTKRVICMINGEVVYDKIRPEIDCSRFTQGMWLNSRSYAQKTAYYQGRYFNRALSMGEMYSLWNGGHPEEYRMIDKSNLFAEYIPEYLSLSGWKDSSGNGNDLTAMGSVVLSYGKRYSGSELTPLFVARGAVFNNNTGYYELNGLKDITEPQMRVIYIFTAYVPSSITSCRSLFYYTKIRTNFPPTSLSYNEYVGGKLTAVEAPQMFRSNFVPEVINLGVRGIKIKGECFYWAYSDILNTRLKYVLGVIDITEATLFSSPFGYCEGLETVQIKGCKVSVEIKHSKALTRDSILYLITNASNTTPITVTLHADAFARLSEADIALASSKNITIAVA